jgi:hypothetical protein
MSFHELPPSKQWSVLRYKGQRFAEVWFKPEGEPLGLTFRIPQEGFQIPGMGEQLTMENLLKAVGVAPEEVESWRIGDLSDSGMHGANPHFKNALSPPAQHLTHVEIHVRLKPPATPAAADKSDEDEIPPAMWQDLENRWRAILGLEAAMDTLRINMESQLGEMESSWKKPMTIEEKTYAPRADVAQWNKAKTRVLNAIPKMKDFIHRSVWALGSPERKRLEEVYNNQIQPHIPIPHCDDVLKHLEELRKDRQVLSAHGKTVYQECKAISAELQSALRMLQVNSAKAQKKKGATGSKGRFH